MAGDDSPRTSTKRGGKYGTRSAVSLQALISDSTERTRNARAEKKAGGWATDPRPSALLTRAKFSSQRHSMPGRKIPADIEVRSDRGWPRSTAVEMGKKLREDAPAGFPPDLARDGSPGSLGESKREPPKNRPAPFKIKGGR